MNANAEKSKNNDEKKSAADLLKIIDEHGGDLYEEMAKALKVYLDIDR